MSRSGQPAEHAPALFRRFETLIDPTRPPAHPEPPANLLRFYWHFLRQAKGLFGSLLAVGFGIALLDAAIPYFIGQLIDLIAETPRERLFAESWPILLAMALAILILRPLFILCRSLVTNQGIAASFGNMVRWQSHWHVVRQSWGFFQNDFAGRIANRIMQVGPALRETVVASTDAVWYITVYGLSALVLLASADWRLAVPIAIWFIAYVGLLWYFVPRLRERSRINSNARSILTGRIVDSYTNILTVKLFARAREEDAYVRDSLAEHTRLFQDQLRLITGFTFVLATINAFLIVITGGLALMLTSTGAVAVGTVAMVLPLTWQIVNISGWVAFQVSAIFENVGVVQESTLSIARPLQLADHPGAVPIRVDKGDIRFEHVRFAYGREQGVIEDVDLHVRPGEKIGVVGRSGAGKSTLINLLLRFFDLEGGRIRIDGQDIAGVTQESLRAAISVVTQDTSLLHRSISENISYGRPTAGASEIEQAARRAHAHDFILDLEDLGGRTGYEAHVGERGVKLSGGQRQRIAIARVILKNAPILVLDEATSALDSEVEAAIQTSLETLMEGKTVIAVAHRLSTIARMDRLIVLDRGRIVEEGTHGSLIAKGGHYAQLWHRQSGGFLGDEHGVQAATADDRQALLQSS
ncbi:ABC transporter ATP-binding protein [Marinivivus vitaminiproducens]|uniref:ABC transporter ATP-binding protein n=1 Tax=Marinivivus vitaminiproducens TaxID=3035935 RepID=UPI00279E21FF|nr:ABC transporter ATP-binding protein [Geminicoccaceae bacterium SCSIO 64248]